MHGVGKSVVIILQAGCGEASVLEVPSKFGQQFCFRHCERDIRQESIWLLFMEAVISFFVTVVGGVVCHLIVKWLDGNHKGNK